MKFGDFGTGGRSYSRIWVGGNGGSGDDKACHAFCIVLLALIAFGGLFITEKNFHMDIGVLDEAYENAHVLKSTEVAPENEHHLVFVTSPHPTLIGSSPQDPLLGFQAPQGYALLSRVAEYCQWEEIRHSTTTRIGTDRQDNPIYRTDVSFSYYKGWRGYQIASYLFDNPVAYHNPARDPAPSRAVFAGDVDLAGVGDDASPGAGESLRMSSENLGEALEAAVVLPLTNKNAASLPPEAEFTELDGRYMYSRQQKAGRAGSFLAALFIDGVVDFGEAGSCAAGDVRVHFEGQACS